MSFFSARRRKRGEPIFRPSDKSAKWVRPRSIPAACCICGNGSGVAHTTKLAKYRPAASTITVILDGAAGRARDQRTVTSPIFGSRSFPPDVICHLALAVKRMACR